MPNQNMKEPSWKRNERRMRATIRTLTFQIQQYQHMMGVTQHQIAPQQHLMGVVQHNPPQPLMGVAQQYSLPQHLMGQVQRPATQQHSMGVTQNSRRTPHFSPRATQQQQPAKKRQKQPQKRLSATSSQDSSGRIQQHQVGVAQHSKRIRHSTDSQESNQVTSTSTDSPNHHRRNSTGSATQTLTTSSSSNVINPAGNAMSDRAKKGAKMIPLEQFISDPRKRSAPIIAEMHMELPLPEFGRHFLRDFCRSYELFRQDAAFHALCARLPGMPRALGLQLFRIKMFLCGQLVTRIPARLLGAMHDGGAFSQYFNAILEEAIKCGHRPTSVQRKVMFVPLFGTVDEIQAMNICTMYGCTMHAIQPNGVICKKPQMLG